MFSPKKSFSYISGKRTFLYFRKWNCLALTITFRRKLSQLEKLKNLTFKNFIIFWEVELSSLKLKNSCIFSEKNFEVTTVARGNPYERSKLLRKLKER